MGNTVLNFSIHVNNHKNNDSNKFQMVRSRPKNRLGRFILLFKLVLQLLLVQIVKHISVLWFINILDHYNVLISNSIFVHLLSRMPLNLS